MNLSSLTREIFTPRLHLELMTEAHVSEIAEMFAESYEQISRFYSPAWSAMGDLPDEQELAQLVESWLPAEENPTGFSFCAYQGQGAERRLVGMGECHHIDWDKSEGLIGYWMRTSEEGKGYATEIANAITRYSFDITKFKLLALRAEARNPGSSRVAEKLGFDFDGIVNNDAGWNLRVYTRTDKAGLPDLSIRYQ